MKIITSKDTPGYLIDIVFSTPAALAVAAATVSHPTSVKKRYLVDEQTLAEYNDLIDTAISIIKYYHFDLVKERQAKGSYSYYIDTFPTDENGVRWDDNIRIRFRFANHENEGVNNQKSNRFNRRSEFDDIPSEITYVRSYVIGTKSYPDKRYVISDFKKVCQHLKAGDYSDFIK